ncbi:MAG: ATP-binding protein, partial [Chloroflexota bacterium]
AFPNDRSGRVEIHSQVEEGEATVVVRDDGIGMPPGFDPERAPSLGMRIVRNLVRTDLKGRFELHTEAGTVATITFPVTPKLQAMEPSRELTHA